jgi:hypothetical protein
MTENNNNHRQEDHDLLIELRTEMKALRSDVKDLKDNTSKRVDALENEKIDRIEVTRLKNDADKIHDDHEARIRAVEKLWENFTGKWAILAALATIMLSALVSLGVSMLK